MSRGNVPILPIAHKVIYPGARVQVSLPNPREFARGKRLTVFGIITYKNPQKQELHQYGTLVGVVSEEPLPRSNTLLTNFFNSPLNQFSRNEWQLFVIGLERFKLLSVQEEGGYMYGSVQVVKDTETSLAKGPFDELKSKAIEYVKAASASTAGTVERVKLIHDEQDPTALGFKVATTLDLPVKNKQDILECFNLEQRTYMIIQFLENNIQTQEFSPEIRQSLNDKLSKEVKKQIDVRSGGPKQQDALEMLLEKLNNISLPEDSREQVMNEFNRLKGMQPNQAEYSVIRNYLDTVVSLPWNSSTTDNIDIIHAKQQLDQDHFGMEKVKNRILEYLAVRKLRGDMKGSILCFHGPPGVGKTSLGKSIAQAMGRKFNRIALGGVRDEAEIRGHRRTYVGAIPGAFIAALRSCGSNNPVILLDEIDKVGTDRMRGDPAAALLEVLDPEQNNSFVDHYLAIPFDLSRVLFLATANNLQTIPGPLLDRMEIIDLSSYSTQDKVQIARAYLIPKQIKENGLIRDNIEFTEEGITNIILNYTRESGVRQLERNIGSVCRWVAVRYSEHQASENQTPFNCVSIVPDLVEVILGVPIYQNDYEHQIASPGVAIGLAWTAVGGKTMLVETSKSVGAGRLRITGQLGEVMKESILTAMSWIREHFADVLPPPMAQSQNEGFDGLDIHVHFPAAAVPKDGPSAGVTITTALVSLISGIKVLDSVAMTGEVSLRGNVLPVGGIKEKVLGAHRVGIRRIILPEQNKKDLRDLPQNILNEMTFVLVGHVLEVLAHALADTSHLEHILKSRGTEISSKL